MQKLTLFAFAATAGIVLTPVASQAQHPGGGGSKFGLGETPRSAQSRSNDGSIRYRLGGSSTMTVGVEREQRIDIQHRLTSIAGARAVPQERLAGVRIAPGSFVPREKVRIRRLPADVVSIAPEYINYEYFLLEGGSVVIVDPRSYEIMDVIGA